MKLFLDLFQALAREAQSPAWLEADLLEDVVCRVCQLLRSVPRFAGLQSAVIIPWKLIPALSRVPLMDRRELDSFSLVTSPENSGTFSRTSWTAASIDEFRSFVSTCGRLLDEFERLGDFAGPLVLPLNFAGRSAIVFASAPGKPSEDSGNGFGVVDDQSTNLARFTSFVAVLMFADPVRCSDQEAAVLQTWFSLFVAFLMREKHHVLEMEDEQIDNAFWGVPAVPSRAQFQLHIGELLSTQLANDAQTVASRAYLHKAKHRVGKYKSLAHRLEYITAKSERLCRQTSPQGPCSVVEYVKDIARELAYAADLDSRNIEWAYMAAAGAGPDKFQKESLDLAEMVLESFGNAVDEYLVWLEGKPDSGFLRTENGAWLAPLLLAKDARGHLCAIERVLGLAGDQVAPLDERIALYARVHGGLAVPVLDLKAVFPVAVRLLKPSPRPEALEAAFRELFLNAFRHGALLTLEGDRRMAVSVVSLERANDEIIFELEHPARNLDTQFYSNSLTLLGHDGLGTNIRFFSSLCAGQKALTLIPKDGPPRFLWQCRFSPSIWAATAHQAF